MENSLPSIAEMLDFKGKTAVVTGGAQGIGLAVAVRLAEAGAAVTIADLAPPAASAFERGEVRSIHFRELDVSDAEACMELARDVAQEFASLDIWVNSAGIFPITPLTEISVEEWRKVISVNLDGTFYGARAASSQMTSGASIVNILSASAFRVSGDGRAHYASSKGGARSLTQALARELGGRGIRVLGVAPTATITEGTTGGSEEAVATLRAYARDLPLQRVATADDIARVVLFAVSDLASIMTGSVIAADAGQLAV